jgi:hypothetical protein
MLHWFAFRINKLNAKLSTSILTQRIIPVDNCVLLDIAQELKEIAFILGRYIANKHLPNTLSFLLQTRLPRSFAPLHESGLPPVSGEKVLLRGKLQVG